MVHEPHVEETRGDEPDRGAGAAPTGDEVARGASGRAERRSAQQAETAHTVADSGPVQTTPGQWHGMVLGGLIGAVVGAALALPVAVIPFMEPLAARLLLLAISGALAGAAAGGVYGGGRMPEVEGETNDAGGRPSVGTSRRDPHTHERGG